ncbi:MAG: SAM-dependent methyltransferase [Thermomicrobiales bacterium]
MNDPNHERQQAREASDSTLVAAIRAEIAAQGRITFARFMDLALYHPTHGYYHSAQERPGRGGDFVTAPELTPFFGHCLMRQLHQCWQELGHPAEFTILEYGSGGGRLAHDLLVAARDEAPDFAAAIRYLLHETNSHRRAAALDLLSAAGFGQQVALDTGDEPAPLTGAILTNEFIDALPVHRIAGGQAGELLERYVTWDAAADWFAEHLDHPSTPQLAAALAAAGVTLAAGQSAEINLAAGEWLATATARLSQGVVLTIDYGYDSVELYSPRRREGTFLCYYRHTALDDPYVRIGAQDMTAHIDFGGLIRAGERLGLTTLGFATQGPFLSNLGLGDLLVATQRPDRALDDYLADRTAVLTLIDPRRMGRFGVLAQGKSFSPAAPLRGFHPLI